MAEIPQEFKIVLRWSERQQMYVAYLEGDQAVQAIGVNVEDVLADLGRIYQDLVEEDREKYDPRPADPKWWQKLLKLEWPWGLGTEA